MVFLAENLYLLGRDGQTKQCVVSYDNHGSKTFLSGQLSDDFLHSEPERRQFQIDTVQGKDVTCRNIYKLQLLTLKGRLELEAVASNWVEPSEEPLFELLHRDPTYFHSYRNGPDAVTGDPSELRVPRKV